MPERTAEADWTRGLIMAVALSAALVAAVFRVWRKRTPLKRHVRAKSDRDGDSDGNEPNSQPQPGTDP